MGLFFSPTTIFVAVLLLYLSSFILFAIIRIATGVSIQRIGYFSLRRIAYTPKEGVHIEIRGLGLSLHRPSFAQPTWVSLRLTDLKVTFAPKAVGGWDAQQKAWEEGSESQGEEANGDPPSPDQEPTQSNRGSGSVNKTWKTLSGLNEKIKKMHKQINWMAMVDVVATNTTVRFIEAGQIQVGSFTMAVDTRRKMVDRGRLFRHKKDPSGDQKPVEWIVNIRNILLTVDGRESIEISDNLGLNIHGLLYSNLEGLRDTSVAVKLGRLHIPCDDLMVLSERFKGYRRSFSTTAANEAEDEISFADIVEELDKPGTREEAIVQTVADSKEFVSSVLRGIQEIQVALSFFRISREVRPFSQTDKSLLLNLVTHEVGIDFHRMDPKRPAHRMYFQRNDVAHQALLAAISISVTLDDSVGETDKLLYIPMATTTIKTTLPSKTVNFSGNPDPAARNSNILFGNLVVTSPSVDIEPKHLSQLLALTQAKALSSRGKTKSNRNLISRLLPKASIKLSIHEPVLRFVLPVGQDQKSSEDDYNLLISSISSISLDIESSHSAERGLHYSLSSIYRITSHQLYYQTASGFKHNLLVTESMELKAHLNATPEVCVVASGTLTNYSVHMVSGDVSRGVNEIVNQFRTHAELAANPGSREAQKPRFLRRLPPWLLSFQFEATGFSVEVAGIDQTVGPTTRGLALQLQSWTAEYRAQSQEPDRKAIRRRTPSHSAVGEESSFRFHSRSPSKKSYQRPEDGRRLAINVRGLEGFVIESEGYMEPESFLNLPRFEVSFSTSSDLQGPIFHINSAIKELYLQYSVYRCYALGVAASVLQDAFMHDPSRKESARPRDDKPRTRDSDSLQDLQDPLKIELVTVDVKASLIQVRATMPADPPMLLQVYGLATGRHRWSSPFLRAQLVRLHAEAPKLRGVWARIVSMNSIRIDLRENRRKQGRSLTKERSIDLATDFIRFAVPHHMVMHRIFDNFVNSRKVLEQLYHRFKTRTDEYILKKHPEGPKKVPRVSVRSKALLFELEDDAFEWKLGSIYRLGLLEQKQRLAREEAFHMKVRKTEELRHHEASSRYRTRSHPFIGDRPRRHRDKRRSKSTDGDGDDEDDEGTQRPVSRGRRPKRPRYDPDGMCNISGSAKVSAEDAWYKLQQHNSRSWKRRIDSNLRFQNRATKEIRSLFSGADDPPEDMQDDKNILAIPDRPGLMSALISDIHLVIDKPSFPIEAYAQYLHKIGKGMPLDMRYSLLIPMNVQLDMGEARVNLRDYPLDLLHIPALRPGQSPRLPSWSLRTDFVIAEEFRDYRSFRNVEVNIIPPGQTPEGNHHSGFSVDVKRTVSPVKTYSDVTIEINTSLPTSISWGMSFQPVVQDMMKIIEGFSKPAIDPSDRVGFWDKIRLSFHSRINVVWKGDGDVHFRLKGSRDPYVVTGFGAGFVMCWRKDVRWEIHTRDDPRKFMTVTSGEYVLAVPDYSHQARHAIESPGNDVDRTSSAKNVVFKKVIMKLFGNVQWLAGLVFERDLKNGGRSLEFKPHYDVVLKNPKYIDDVERRDYDAFRAFRSNHIHLSVAVVAPTDRDWAVPNKAPSTSYNTVHLTPRFFTHFFNWWSLFSGVMSLPVRQGPLWPGLTKSSKKFSRHLATIKYNLLFSPLFLSHIYKHKDVEEYSDDVVSATGLKVRLDSFLLDLHQRREQINTQVKGRSKQMKTSAMRINQAQLDFVAADFRAISATIGGTNSGNLQNATADFMSGTQQEVPAVDLSQFTIPDMDYDWIDMDDFVEIDWVLPSESNPKTQILPLAYAPRFTYFRQTDHGHSGPDETGYSHFGDEPTHYCVMSDDNDPRRVQMELVTERLADIDAQIEYHERAIGEQELRVIRDGHQDSELKVHFELLVRQSESLQKRRKFLSAGLRRLERQLLSEGLKSGTRYENQSGPDSSEAEDSAESSPDGSDPQIDGLYASPDDGFVSDFNNRFIIHNIQLKWNNSLRNIILRYSHQVSQRRGFVYYMSRRAVKFILDIVEEQGKNKRSRSGIFEHVSFSDSDHGMAGGEEEKDESVEDRIEQLLSDANRFVNADDAVATENKSRPVSADDGKDIAPEFTPQNSYHLRLIAPQIQLQSEKNKKSVALITAKGMQLKVVSIMDKHRVSDDVSGLVQRRFSLDMDSAQFFVTTQKHLFRHIQLYSGNKYGNAPGSAWPPWVALEAVFDFSLNPFGFSKIIQKTSASLRYDKYNTLRLKYNEEVASGEDGLKQDPENGEDRMDQIWVDFPHLRAICDSSQYYSMYIIVLDLLLYSEPLAKVRSERLEKIMLASDFSDLRGAPETVNRLQRRIRQLEEIKNHFQIEARYLDKQGWEDRIAVEKDLASCEDELFFIMKAITTSQRKGDDRTSSRSHGILRWYISASEVVWHLMKNRTEPLVEFQLRKASYERTDNSDGSNHNIIEIKRLHGLNLLPNAIYPQMIVPYLDQNRRGRESDDESMLRVRWLMLDAIAGIPVLEYFEVDLFPLKVQLERDLGQKLFEYIFPGIGADAFENGGFSPFMVRNMRPLEDDEGSDDEETPDPSTTASPSLSNSSLDEPHTMTGPGAIELRLQPTHTLADHRRANPPSTNRKKHLTMTPLRKSSPKGLNSADRARSTSRPASSRLPKKKSSLDSLRLISRQSTEKPPPHTANGNEADERSKRFALTSKERLKGDKATDDLTTMMTRASNYMTLAHVKINDVVLCLSYKGKGERNIEDVHDFVFRLPVLEYQNKTWSNLDLALRLKKDVIKALISHTPAILGNKFSHNRPSKQQQKRLRELANSAQTLPSSESAVNTVSDGDRSFISRSSNSERSESPPRRSFNSAGSPLARSASNLSIQDPDNPRVVIRDSDWTEEDSPVQDTEHGTQPPSGRRASDNKSIASHAASSVDSEGSRKKTVRNLGRKFLGSLN